VGKGVFQQGQRSGARAGLIFGPTSAQTVRHAAIKYFMVIKMTRQFYRLDHANGQMFLTQMLMHDLFAVANLLVLN